MEACRSRLHIVLVQITAVDCDGADYNCSCTDHSGDGVDHCYSGSKFFFLDGQ